MSLVHKVLQNGYINAWKTKTLFESMIRCLWKVSPKIKNPSLKHAYIMLTSLKPYFYTVLVKLGFAGLYIIFLISAQKHKLWYSLELPQ